MANSERFKELIKSDQFQAVFKDIREGYYLQWQTGKDAHQREAIFQKHQAVQEIEAMFSNIIKEVL